MHYKIARPQNIVTDFFVGNFLIYNRMIKFHMALLTASSFVSLLCRRQKQQQQRDSANIRVLPVNISRCVEEQHSHTKWHISRTAANDIPSTNISPYAPHAPHSKMQKTHMMHVNKGPQQQRTGQRPTDKPWSCFLTGRAHTWHAPNPIATIILPHTCPLFQQS